MKLRSRSPTPFLPGYLSRPSIPYKRDRRPTFFRDSWPAYLIPNFGINLKQIPTFLSDAK
uniref:Clone 1496 transcribed RNA sequence n=1 Tax=Plectreurys tristis TaxID=33319 RepID=A0A0C4W9Z0_PLETR|nr:hypothetical protein [Plectreurys tristis]